MISIKVDTREVEKGLAGLARRIEDMRPVADDFGAHMVRTWVLKFRRTPGHEPAPASGPPAIQSGHLRASLTHEVRQGGQAVEAGSPEVYARIQHLGGEIRPREKKALTVPISPRSYGKRAKDFAGLFRVPAKPGQEPEDLGILAIRSSSGGIIPLFALRAKVTLPARPWLLIYPENLTYLGNRMARHLVMEHSPWRRS